MIEHIDAVPDDGDDLFESPGREAKSQKMNNLMPLPSVSGYGAEDYDVEVLYDGPIGAAGSDDDSQIDTEENRECLERVKRSVEKFYSLRDNLYWDLSRDIFNVVAGRLFRLTGHKKFEDYVSNELDFSMRKANYLVKVYKYYALTLKAQLVDQPDLYNEIIEKVKKIGWTKAEKIAKKKVLTADNARALFEKFTEPNARGRAPSVPEIEDIVAKEYNSKSEEDRLEADEDNEIETVNFRFNCSKAQANSVTDALDLAKKMCSQNSKPSTHFAWVCAEFAAGYSMDRGFDIDIKTTMARFEDILGVDIVVLDRVTGAVKYGHETAKALKNTPS